MVEKIYSRKTPDEIKNLVKSPDTLEAFILIDNGIFWQLKKLVYYRFFIAFKPRNEFWDFLEHHLINKFSFYFDVCTDFKLIQSEELKINIGKFNQFRTRIIHKILDEKIPKSELEQKCNLGLEIIIKLNKIANDLWLKYRKEQPKLFETLSE